MGGVQWFDEFMAAGADGAVATRPRESDKQVMTCKLTRLTAYLETTNAKRGLGNVRVTVAKHVSTKQPSLGIKKGRRYLFTNGGIGVLHKTTWPRVDARR
jgi:hypothetical protein